MSFNPNAMMKKQFEKMISQRFGSVDNMMNDMSKFAGNNPTLKNALDLYKKGDTESKRKMDDSMKEYTSDIVRNLTEMWSDADATLRQSMKTDLTRLIQQMN